MKKNEPPVLVEQYFDLSPERVWRAITNPAEMRQWFFEQMLDFQPVVGFYTEFVIQHEGRTFTHCWTIREVIPEKKIVYRWNYPEYPGDSNVHFTIQTLEGGCLLRVSTEILEDYPDDIPEFKRESAVAGWKYFIQERLPAYLKT